MPSLQTMPMILRRIMAVFALSVTILAAATGIASAASTSSKGLQITPIRQFLSVDAGKATQSHYTVANHTDNSLTVTLSAQQFSVANYTYDYTFSPPANDWLHLGLTTVSLQPNQSIDVPFTLHVPAGSQPGGYYYTLFASATLPTKGLSSTIQAADLLYVTVNGKLTRTSHLQTSSIRRVSFGRSIPFTLQPVNTGNTHFFAYVSGQLHGPLTKQAGTPDTHILMPGKPRTITASIPSPVLPGVYRATYGYKTDQGQSVMVSSWIVFIPPWFIAFLLATLLVAGKFFTRKKAPAEPSS